MAETKTNKLDEDISRKFWPFSAFLGWTLIFITFEWIMLQKNYAYFWNSKRCCFPTMYVAFLWTYYIKSYFKFSVLKILKTTWETPHHIVVNDFLTTKAVEKICIVLKSWMLWLSNGACMCDFIKSKVMSFQSQFWDFNPHTVHWWVLLELMTTLKSLFHF